MTDSGHTNSTPKERHRRIVNEKKFAPLFVGGGFLMVAVCSLVNLAELKNLDALFSMLPFTAILAFYSCIQLWKR